MKVSLNIKRDIKEITVRDIPVLKGTVVESFKHFEINSERGDFRDAVMMLHVNDSDAAELSKVDKIEIEKKYNEAVLLRRKLSIHNVVGSYVFLRYNLDGQRFVINSAGDFIASTGKHYFELNLNESHGIAPHDYEYNTHCTIELNDKEGNELCKTSDFFVSSGKNYSDSSKIYINVPSIYTPERGYSIVLNFDQFVYNDVVDESGDIPYTGDWHFYSEFNEGVGIRFTYNNSNLCVPIALSSDTDYSGLRQNEVVDTYYKKITEGIIPDFINPEKTKYVPYVCDKKGEPSGEATRIEFYLHFRTRHKDVLDYDSKGFPICDAMPTDSWSIETEETFPEPHSNTTGDWNYKYWNEFDDWGYFLDKNGNNELLYSGDLIGNLGFTDNDILNRKKKVKQSFLRLSFYNSNNPMQTSMLFYSTIFLDVNKLYSKYIKLYTSSDYDKIMSEHVKSKESGDTYDNHWGLVVFDGTSPKSGEYHYDRSELLTTDITVSNEHDSTSSAEGFNLYLFSDDSPKDGEERIIYLKIEFNHAGYGRTFPMILWPGLDGNATSALTNSNYYEYLYIPVAVRYNKERNVYTYHIQRATNDTENNVIKFALFEPKIEPITEGKYNEGN